MKKVAFILDGFEPQTPGQQLLDRFLIGCKLDGAFRPADSKVVLALPNALENALVRARQQDFGLEVAESTESAVARADFVVVAPGRKNFQAPENLEAVFGSQKMTYLDARLLVPGALSPDRELRALREASIIVSRAASHFIPLPVRPNFDPNAVKTALIVVQGAFPEAELDALYALKPYLPSRWAKTDRWPIERLTQTGLWNFLYTSRMRKLLEAALSRSDNIKGDPERDGRTQDIVGLQLIEKLAPNARAAHLESLSTEIVLLVCDGALADVNFAVETNTGVHSAQLYHPQPPMENHYDLLAGWINERFSNGPERNNFSDALVIGDIIRSLT